MSKNNQDIINIKNILSNVATSQKHLVTDSSTKKSSPTTKDSKKASLDKTSSVPVEGTDSINIAKGDSSIESKKEIEKIKRMENKSRFFISIVFAQRYDFKN